MLGGPIPNSLGAGAYNATFIQHGLVVFMPSGGVNIPDVLQEVCLDAVLNPDILVTAEVLQDLAVSARLDQNFATPAVLHATLTTDAEVLRDLQLDAIIEECP